MEFIENAIMMVVQLKWWIGFVFAVLICTHFYEKFCQD